MKKIDKIIKILEDGEKDFKLKPNVNRKNYLGLCFYICCHPLMTSLTQRTKTWYIKTILKDMKYSSFCFTKNSSQTSAWTLRIPRYNTERADWCKIALEKIQKEGL